MFLLFFFNDTATTEIYTLSLHDALPIYPARQDRRVQQALARRNARVREDLPAGRRLRHARGLPRGCPHQQALRSEEHTSELQSQSNLVCRLLLEKKKKIRHPLEERLRIP